MAPGRRELTMRSPNLTWREVADYFHCGRNKALRIVHQCGCIYCGRTPLLPIENLRKHLEANNGDIRIDWGC